MKILYTVDPELPVPPHGYGGIERIVDALAREMRRWNHTVGLVAHPESTCPVDALYGWPEASFRPSLRNMLALGDAVRRFRPDVVHSFSRLAYLTPLFFRKIPKIMSYQRHTGGRPVSWAVRLAGRSLRFTGCSEFICGMGRRAGGDWRPIPNFVELEKYPFAPAVPPDAPLVFLSRIESIKGPHLAIEIARRTGRRLIIAGNRLADGPEAEYFERQIAPHFGKDGIEYIGEVDDAKKAVLLAGAAALVVPIQWDEPFGIVFVEALATGTPVISSPRGALPEILPSRECGFLVNTIEEGVAAVQALANIDRAACRRRAEDFYSSRIVASQYLALYQEMIS